MPQEHVNRVHSLCSVPTMHPALLFDNGENSFLWTAEGTGADWTAEHDPAAAFVQTNGILLKTKATAPAANDVVTISRCQWLPPEQIVRLQLVFAHVNAAISQYLKIIMHWYTGARHYVVGMRSEPLTSEVARATGLTGIVPDFTVMPDLSIPAIDGIWNKLDFSANWRTAYHHLLQWNHSPVDLSTTEIYSDAAITGTFFQVYIELETLQAAQAEAYLDQVLLTSENP